MIGLGMDLSEDDGFDGGVLLWTSWAAGASACQGGG